MGDILSQDEIDALLSSQEVDDLRKMLVKWVWRTNRSPACTGS